MNDLDRFEMLKTVLPTSSHLWLEDAKVNQDHDGINIQHWEIDPVWTYTGTTVIYKTGDKLTAIRHWLQGSYPVEQDEITHWLNRLEEIYSPQLLLNGPVGLV